METDSGTTSSSPSGASATPVSFDAWLTQLKATYAAVVAVAAALLGLFAPDRLVPEPLHGLRVAATLLAVLSLALTWGWRGSLRRRLRAVSAVAFVLAAALALLNVNFVEPVEYAGGVTRYVLVGPSPVDPRYALLEPAEIVQLEGWSRATLRRIYGGGFTAVFSAYAVCYVLLLPATVLALGGTQLAAPRGNRRR